ncbi:MAG: hypothetical protein R3C18_17485 [Planctomycetaceae bacterium]
MACSLNAVINRELVFGECRDRVRRCAGDRGRERGEYSAVESPEGDFDLAADLTVVYSMYPQRWVEFVLASADDGLWSSGVFNTSTHCPSVAMLWSHLLHPARYRNVPDWRILLCQLDAECTVP